MNVSAYSHLPLFKDCNNEEIEKFLTCVQPRILQFESEQLILSQDDDLQDIYLLLSGQLGIYRLSGGGQLNFVNALDSGDVFGHLTAFSHHQTNPLSLICLRKTTCMVFPSQVFYQRCSAACRSHQMVTRNMLALIADQALHLSEKLSYLSCLTLKGKIARYLINESAKHPQGYPFVVPHNRETMAQLLAVARPSLSRSLKQMKADGLIDFDRNTFRILKPVQLEALE